MKCAHSPYKKLIFLGFITSLVDSPGLLDDNGEFCTLLRLTSTKVLLNHDSGWSVSITPRGIRCSNDYSGGGTTDLGCLLGFYGTHYDVWHCPDHGACADPLCNAL